LLAELVPISAHVGALLGEAPYEPCDAVTTPDKEAETRLKRVFSRTCPGVFEAPATPYRPEPHVQHGESIDTVGLLAGVLPTIAREEPQHPLSPTPPQPQRAPTSCQPTTPARPGMRPSTSPPSATDVSPRRPRRVHARSSPGGGKSPTVCSPRAGGIVPLAFIGEKKERFVVLRSIGNILSGNTGATKPVRHPRGAPLGTRPCAPALQACAQEVLQIHGRSSAGRLTDENAPPRCTGASSRPGRRGDAAGSGATGRQSVSPRKKVRGNARCPGVGGFAPPREEPDVVSARFCRVVDAVEQASRALSARVAETRAVPRLGMKQVPVSAKSPVRGEAPAETARSKPSPRASAGGRRAAPMVSARSVRYAVAGAFGAARGSGGSGLRR